MNELIIAHELIGLECEVVDSPNRYEVGLAGEIVDETMKTLLIRTDRGYKRIAKADRKFKLRVGDSCVELDGNLIAYRPEERIKRGLLIIKRFKGNLRKFKIKQR
ncbi:ribonuclease P protein subunit Rpp29 [Archaeoglobus sulfaticallidus PM70-1]|uniref:Ribonuclease P protein component 1 n=1 Tax=Archaeoglobus sulfaticallidus PM70-1 TaxID=387631 RepID=N0BI78_9EURY|nr:ribonuclease P protein subunit [Archaeoglobus sulfaticallidus]AGK60156.1 ribonuclease P protein subunit Rpp29 [Archaeoglobus sulfaticallidus PM70-1]